MTHLRTSALGGLLVACVLAACRSTDEQASDAVATKPAPTASSATATPASAPAKTASPDAPMAADFTLTDVDGKAHRLADYRGKPVVLEWTNHQCPFVVKHYSSDNMQSLQREATAKGVVWLTINSSASGKQGHVSPADAKRLMKEKGAAPTAYLFDGNGEVGKRYGAKTTPHMFVIDAAGHLVYDGAIDDKRSPNPADIATSKNLVRAALDDVLAGRPVATPRSEPYGCSVKYAD